MSNSKFYVLPREAPSRRQIPNNLPLTLAPLVGREQDVQVVHDLLIQEDVRLLTLLGPGGVGKTRLALRVAEEALEEFEDGVYFVELASIADPERVAQAIAATLQLPEAPGAAPMATLKEHLQGKTTLLVLDNFEQVVPAGSMMSELLVILPSLKLLVTSRSPLRVRSERKFVVAPLALPQAGRHLSTTGLAQYGAIELFVQRAKLADPDFELTADNDEAVAELCRRVDGLPLAIELVAARIKVLSPQSILARMASPLRLLRGGAPDAPNRHQTMRDTIEWSYDLLDEEEQRLFRCLSVFVGGLSIRAAEAVSNEEGDIDIAIDAPGAIEVLDGVGALVDKSLLRRLEGSEGGDRRLGMLETVREYALEQLVASGEAESMQRRHADYFVALAELAKANPEAQPIGAWVDRLNPDHDNLRAALSWLLERGEAGASEAALRLYMGVKFFWSRRSYPSEGEQWLANALAQAPPQPTRLRVMALKEASILARSQGEVARARAWAEQAVATASELGDKGALRSALTESAIVEVFEGNYSTARSVFEDSLAIDRELGDEEGIAISLLNVGELALYQGDYTSAERSSKESLEILKRLHEQTGTEHSGILLVLTNVGKAALRLGNLQEARAALYDALALAREIYSWQRAAAALTNLCGVLLAEMDEQAERGPGRRHLPGMRQVARLSGLAAELLERSGKRLEPLDEDEFEHNVAAARAGLGEEAFAVAWEEGRAMTLDQALELATGSNLPDDAEAGQSEPDHLQQAYPDGLTEREVDVLRLIVAGKSNQEISHELVLSLRTVERHISNIYQKIGATGRIARATATAYALKHGLTGSG